MTGSSRLVSIPRSWRSGLLVALVASFLLAAAASAQRPQFRTRVDLVQFQVRVTDGSGGFVPGLTVDDFRLEVNGRERPITTVYEVDLTEEPAAQTAAARPPAAWRQWMLFFDAAFNTPRGVFAAQEAARDFVENRVSERDLVGVATFSTVVGARLVVPLTRDREQVLTAIEGLGLNSATRNVDRAGFLAQPLLAALQPADATTGAGAAAGVDINAAVEEAIRQVGNLEFDQYASVVAQYTEQLDTIGEMLRTIRGRKHVVFFSQGFADAVISGQSLDALAANTDAMQQNAGLALATSSGEDRFGSAEVRSSLDDALATFRSADSVIHVVDPTGVGGGRDRTNIGGAQTGAGDFAARGGTRSALTALADATGGDMFWETNDLAGALADIEESNRSYYVLAFAREDGDDELLELDVEVTSAGAVVDAPEELAAPDAFENMSEVEKQIQLAEFVTKGIEHSDLVFDVSAAGFAGDGSMLRLPVVIEVPWEQLEDLADSGSDARVELEMFTYALDEGNRLVDFSSGEVNLNMEAMRGSPAAGLPFRYYDLLWSRPGVRRVRVVLRDKELGRISAYTSQPTSVPDLGTGAVAIGGPFAVDWDHPGLIMRGFDADSPPEHKKDGPVAFPFHVGDEEITPAATLAVDPGDPVHAYFVAHNLGTDANGSPQAFVALALQTPMGQPMPMPGQAMLRRYYDPETDQIHMVVKGDLPADLQSGQYGMMIMLQDQTTGERTTATIPIWVNG